MCRISKVYKDKIIKISKKSLQYNRCSDTISSVVGLDPIHLRRCYHGKVCNAVSHSHRRSNKMWKSNVKSVKVKTEGGAKKMYVCTSCLRSGAVERA